MFRQEEKIESSKYEKNTSKPIIQNINIHNNYYNNFNVQGRNFIQMQNPQNYYPMYYPSNNFMYMPPNINKNPVNPMNMQHNQHIQHNQHVQHTNNNKIDSFATKVTKKKTSMKKNYLKKNKKKYHWKPQNL